MTKFGKIILTVIIILVIGLVVFLLQKPVENTSLNEPVNDDVVIIDQQPTNNAPLNAVGPNASDLLEFSLEPGALVSGLASFTGKVEGAYFFEGNILINVLDAEQNVVKEGFATATTEWMTEGPVEFAGEIDFTGLQPGPGYVEIKNDNPSDEEGFEKQILLPIVIAP